MNVNDILEFVSELAPFSLAESWDNCGLLIGGLHSEVKTVMPVLDVTVDVLKEARNKNVDLIISHHPVIFDGMKNIDANSVQYFAVKNDIAVISAHTNLDMANGGVTDTLCKALGIENTKVLCPTAEIDGVTYGIGAVGNIKQPMTPDELAKFVKLTLGCDGVKLVRGNKEIKTVAVANGSESGMLSYAAAAGADALVAGETKHNVMVDAKNLGITLIDAGHFETENVIVGVLEQKLKQRFPELMVIHSGSNICPYEII